MQPKQSEGRRRASKGACRTAAERGRHKRLPASLPGTPGGNLAVERISPEWYNSLNYD